MEIKFEGEVGLEYWLRWQVPVCALIFIIPAVVAVKHLKKVNRDHLKSTDLWLPCWRNLNPLWLLLYRVFAFASMAFLLYQILVDLGGAFAFYFYTQWTFALVTVYFALATIISARGCWTYSKNPSPKDKVSDDFQKNDSKVSKSKSDASSSENKGRYKYNQGDIECKAGFLEHLMQAIYQICAGASMLTNIVFWCLLVPFLLGENFRLTPLIASMHSVNAVFLIIDSTLNSQPFPSYGFAYFVLWGVSYVVFQWTLHACGFTWWPYPFLEIATPWAPLWYLALALVHVPCYGIYILLDKAKGSIFSWMFPHAFVRSVSTSRRNSMEKKET